MLTRIISCWYSSELITELVRINILPDAKEMKRSSGKGPSLQNHLASITFLLPLILLWGQLVHMKSSLLRGSAGTILPNY